MKKSKPEIGDIVRIIPDIVPGTEVIVTKAYGPDKRGQVIDINSKKWVVGTMDRRDYWYFNHEDLEVISEKTK